jgi:hypothetical protein
MARLVANESEHRRGLVLGLTLAEILLLLLFLLLLALGARLTELRREVVEIRAQDARLRSVVSELEPLVVALREKGGINIDNVNELVQRLARVKELESASVTLVARNAELERRNSELEKEVGILTELGPDRVKKGEALKSVIEKAAEVDPNDPPALLARALEIAKTVGLDKNAEQIKALADMASRAAAAENRVRAAEEEKEKYRRERDNLVRSGRGLVFPSCWIGPKGETEYIFDITLHDGGVVVRDATQARQADDAWKLVESFPRGVEVEAARFRSATRRLYDWSSQHECRFVAIMRDGTGENKERYKYLRTLVEGNFYVHAVDNRVRTSRPSTSGQPQKRPGQEQVLPQGGPLVLPQR